MLVDLPTVPDGVKVHHGICLNYLASYHHVRKTFKKLLNNPCFKGYSVLVTGYSLGGGAVTIVISDLIKLLRSHPDPQHIELIL
ncbi:hypothetical protein DSO57_1003389 [Entomophthora muscae]|uniref:Uncharacterized protein n=1 Tax=Entomophthora muscae TaxID=34485 RepID=A0ACC2TJH2_9FUNG|nr:hypothetical protein DSO57_1003389 [Entomophthora muscae]